MIHYTGTRPTECSYSCYNKSHHYAEASFDSMVEVTSTCVLGTTKLN